MRLLIYGTNGWIGSQFCEYLRQKTVAYYCGKARVDNITTVREEIDTVRPTHILSFIGRTFGTYNGNKIGTIDYLEQPGKILENVRDNLFAPISLALLCKEKQIHFTYLGTGCIFDYDQEHTTKKGYTEDDIPNFFGSSYSIVKGYTDQLMHLLADTALNLRIRMPIATQDHPRNFISKIIRYDKICNIPNSMTVLPNFFPVFLDMMQKERTGTVNCTNPGVISHNEILTMYRDIVESSFTWENFSIQEQNAVLSSKRSNNYLETIAIQEYKVQPIHEAIEDILRNWLI